MVKTGLRVIFLSLAISLLILLLLNYFNILFLSQLYPKQFGWLPHRPYQQPKQLSTQPTAEIPSLETSIKNGLHDYLSMILNSSLIPSNSKITLTQDTTIKESFIARWNTKEGTVSAMLMVSPNGKQINSLNLSFFQTGVASPSVELTQTTIPSFFSVKPKGEWGCKPIYNQIYCENFWKEADGTVRGLSMTGPFPIDKSRVGSIIAFCEHTKDAGAIYSWKSCTTEFAKTGVR